MILLVIKNVDLEIRRVISGSLGGIRLVPLDTENPFVPVESDECCHYALSYYN